MASLKQKTSSIRSRSRQTAEAAVPGVPFGDILRQAREERGLSVEMVAEELMIRQFYLEALENGAYADLPERVYAIGFVNNYVRYLGLESQPMLDQFKREAYGARQTGNYQVNLTMPEPVVHSIVPGRSAIASALVVLTVLIAGIVFFTRTENSEHKKLPPTVPAPITAAAPVVDAPVSGFASSDSAPTTTTAPAASSPTINTSTTEEPEFTSATSSDAPANPPEQAAAPMPIKNQRAIEALQSAWVEIKDQSGKTLYTGILKATQLLPLPDTTKVTMTTGNAGGLRLVLNGQPQPAFGQLNEVKRNIVIDVAAAIPAAMPAPVTTPAPSAAAPAPSATPHVTFER